MRFDRLDLNLLVALDAVLRERHVTKAAERVGLSQPAMSNALARLREHFEDPLLVRVGANMVPTPLGERLTGPVHDLLLKTRAVLDERPSFEPELSERHFTIVSSDFINTLILDRMSEALAVQAPHISIDFVDPDPKRFSDLESGQIDLLIIPRSLTTPIHPSQLLLEDRHVCLIWEHNEIGERISLEDYLARPHVNANFGRPGAEGIEAIHLKKIGVRRRVVMSVPQFSALAHLVVETDRIATIPRRLAMHAARSLPVRIVEPDIDFPVIEEIVQWHSYRDSDPALAWLRDLIGDLAGRYSEKTGNSTSL